ncbi:mediator complex subunit 13 C-terminal-domain-containing protein [Spinellus fusiger]|nr:mediator complex subunit 13 C-terminal-domain-containing protein [Spinellus fusiger]
MLTDASLTNILIVSGVSHIRYRVYGQHCKRSSLADSIKCNYSPESSTATNKKTSHVPTENNLIKTYRELIQLGILSMWRISSDHSQDTPSPEPMNDQDSTDKVLLELWVFWFDEKHTGKIDSNRSLRILEEIKVGSFTWESISSKSGSPMTSPLPTYSRTNYSALVAVTEEYKLFMRSIQNIIQWSMQQKGLLPLGDFLIFPTHCLEEDQVNTNDTASNVSSGEEEGVHSMLSCSYNVYLASTNLIIQPSAHRMKIRPLHWKDLQQNKTKVILGPCGEMAHVSELQQDITPSLESNILQQWSSLFSIPANYLSKPYSKSTYPQRLPALITIITLRNETVLYPTALLFVPISIKKLSTAASSMNSTLCYHQGYTEGLGEKWSRQSWTENVIQPVKHHEYNAMLRNEPQQNLISLQRRINYWNYSSPREVAITNVFDALAGSDTSTSQEILKKAISETTPFSLLVAKSLATPTSFGPKSESTPQESTEDVYDVNDRNSGPYRFYASLSLKKFTTSYFLENATSGASDHLLPPLENNNLSPMFEDTRRTDCVQELDISMHTDIARFNASDTMTRNMSTHPHPQLKHHSNPTGHETTGDVFSNHHQSKMETSSPYLSQNHNMNTTAMGTVEHSYGNHQLEALDGLDTMMYDLSDRWGDEALGDPDNFDFDVTEEDFNFFTSGQTEKQDLFSNEDQKVRVSDFQNGHLLGTRTQTHESDEMLMDSSSLQKMESDTYMDVKEEPVALEAIFKGSQGIFQDTGGMDTPKATSEEKTPMMECDTLMTNVLEIDATCLSSYTVINGMRSYQEGLVANHQDTSISPKTPLHRHDTLSEQCFVPPEFSPVVFSAGVDTAKYYSGGKFVYTPRTHKGKASHRKPKYGMYRPDYVPIVKKRLQKATHGQIIRKESMEVDSDASGLITQVTQKTKDILSEETFSTSSSEDSESGSGSGSEDECDSKKDDTKSETPIQPPWTPHHESPHIGSTTIPTSITTEENMNSVKTLQMNFVKKLLSDTIGRDKGELLNEETDLGFVRPFAEAVVSGAICAKHLPRKALEGEDYKVLEYLCQQAVMGGYPFSGGLAAVSANTGEISEGESDTIVVARRRDLIQLFHGDVAHVPSLSNDVIHVMQSFKSSLIDVFDKSKLQKNYLYPSNLEHLPQSNAIVVRGPLNIQQYYDLSETSQSHSKYGKYQIKKRRPAEPNLYVLSPPNIVVCRQENHIEASSKILTFWDKLRLEPYSPVKNINYFVIFPQNSMVESSVHQFFKSLSTIYDTCLLGAHYAGNAGGYRRGLVPVPLLPKLPDESSEDQQLRSYAVECQHLGSVLGSTMAENMHIVIYFVNPLTHLSSNFDLSRCFHKLMLAYQKSASEFSIKVAEESRARLAMQLIPIEHILRSTSFGGYLKFGLQELAFSVYTTCHNVVGRHHDQISMKHKQTTKEIYTPPFILAKPVPDTIQFSIKDALRPFPITLDDNAVLNLGYCFSLDRRWMIVVWTDHRGELIEYAILDYASSLNNRLSSIFEEAWLRTKAVAKRTGFPWTIVIAKIGLMFEDELKAWTSTIPSDEKVIIVCVDIDSTLNLHFTNDDGNASTEPQQPLNTGYGLMSPTPNSSSMNTGSPHHANSSNTAEMDPGDTHTLLLNHRVAYSQKRENISKGALLTGFSTQSEDWILPLASGYMIHKAPRNDSSYKDQFNGNPLIMEVHLVYNQTSCLSYSALRDIIKRYYSLSFVNAMPSNLNRLPAHLVLVERLCRILLTVDSSL